MTREYTVDTNGSIYYEENGYRYSFTADPTNPDYQAYLAANSGSSVPNDPVGNK